ncbi:MAG: iron ABC transporter permease [Dysgonamonadaceae bacterium]|jgi:iron complex transport system permease protein|nr:iron ABC transporter permease [Dysgonamonadaceae bacterium]
MKRRSLIFFGLALAVAALFLCNLYFGTVSIPAREVTALLTGRGSERSVWANIILQSRLPQTVTALLSGASLAVCGLLLQTLFRNPLAGPSILGITNGANLGVAVVMLWTGAAAQGWSDKLSTVTAAFLGSLLILALLLYFSMKVKNNAMVLIIGIMVGYLASSGISILNSFASADNVRAYVLWGMGTFAGVGNDMLPVYAVGTLAGLLASLLLVKPLNAMLLGDRYAKNLGVDVRLLRTLILIVTGFLTAMLTAFCGPVGFIGLASPHIARIFIGTSNQKILLPATLLMGAAIALFCNELTSIPFGKGLLPLNAVTPLIGAPVILYVIFSGRGVEE